MASSTKALQIRLKCKLNQLRFLVKETLLARWSATRPLRILFTHHPGWEQSIQRGFRFSPHRVFFGDLDSEDLPSYDLVVPLSVESVLQVGSVGSIPSHELLPVPDAACVRLCDDKLLLNRRLVELGFDEFIPPVLDDPSPPFILKKRIAANSDDCYLVRTAQEKDGLARLIASDEFFCQELVGGTSEYASHVLMRDGRIVTEVSIEYITRNDHFIKATEPFIADNVTRSPCRDVMERMLAAIGFEGLCCLNYKMVGGRMRLIEINPRFGGSLAPLFFAFVRHIERSAAPQRQQFSAGGRRAGTSPAGR